MDNPAIVRFCSLFTDVLLIKSIIVVILASLLINATVRVLRY